MSGGAGSEIYYYSLRPLSNRVVDIVSINYKIKDYNSIISTIKYFLN